MKRIDTFLELVVNQKGSDLHLLSGQPPRIRLYGDLIPIKYRELSADETTALLSETMTDQTQRSFETWQPSGRPVGWSSDHAAGSRTSLFDASNSGSVGRARSVALVLTLA